MKKLDFLQSAKSDLLAIAYKHRLLVGENSARKITGNIRSALENLKANPYLGVKCEGEQFTDKDFRRLICGNYLCFYKVKEDRVVVYYIIDGRTDYSRLF